MLGFARGAVLPARDDYARAPKCTRFVIDGGRRAAMIFAHAADGTVAVAVDTYDEAGDAVSDVRYFAKCSKVFPDCLLACVKMLHKRDCFTCTKKAKPCLCDNRQRLNNIMPRKRRKFFVEPEVYYGGRVTIDRRPPWRQTFDTYIMSRVGSYVVQMQHTPVASAKSNTVPPYSIAYRAVYRDMNESDTANMVEAVLKTGVKPNIAARTKYVGMSTVSVNEKNVVQQQSNACCTKNDYGRFDCLLKIPWLQVREKNRINRNNVEMKGIDACVQACIESGECGTEGTGRFTQTLSVAADNCVPIMETKHCGDNVNSLGQSEARNQVITPLSVVGVKRKSYARDNGNACGSGEHEVSDLKKMKCAPENVKRLSDEIVLAPGGEKIGKCGGAAKIACCPNGRDGNAGNSKSVGSSERGEEGGAVGCSSKKKEENESLTAAKSKCGGDDKLYDLKKCIQKSTTPTMDGESKQEKCCASDEPLDLKKYVEKTTSSKRKSCGNDNQNGCGSGEHYVRDLNKSKCATGNVKLLSDEVVAGSADEKIGKCDGSAKSTCCPSGGDDSAEISKSIGNVKKGEEGGTVGCGSKKKGENESLSAANSKCDAVDKLYDLKTCMQKSTTPTTESKQGKCCAADEQLDSKECFENTTTLTVVQKCNDILAPTGINEKQPKTKKCVQITTNTAVERKEEDCNDVTQKGCCPTVVTSIVDRTEHANSHSTDKWSNLKKCIQQATMTCCKTSCGEPESKDAKKCQPDATKLATAVGKASCRPNDKENVSKQASEQCKRPRRPTTRYSQDTSQKSMDDAKSDDTTKDSSHSSYSDIDMDTDSFCSGEEVECCPKVPVVEPDEWDLPSRAIRPSTPSDVLYSVSVRKDAPPSPCMCTPQDDPGIADSITGDVQYGEGDTVIESNRVGVLKWLTRETPIRLLPPIASTGMSSTNRDTVPARSIVR